MRVSSILTLIIVSSFCVPSLCSVLAYTGYALSSPNVRSFLISTGLGNVITRKSQALYEASNFRYAADQGTEIRKAEMDNYEILELDPKSDRKGPLVHVHKYTKEEDRVYSERLFGVLNEMDKNGCVSRLLCEIGADPKSFGYVGMKIHHYLKSAPPVTWNSASFSHLEAFNGGLNSNKDSCNQHYTTCNYDLRRVMKYLWLFMKPINLNVVSKS